MEKTVYWVEYPDKDMAVVVMDDGERQEIMTAAPDDPAADVPSLREDFIRRGFTVHAFTSWLSDNDGTLSRPYRRWKRLGGDNDGANAPLSIVFDYTK